MLYKHGKKLIEATSLEEAARILGTNDVKAYRKPSQKAFMMWCWIRCERKDGRLMKHILGEPADFIEEYRHDPNIVLRELRRAGVNLGDWIMVGEEGYDAENHDEWFYKKEGNEA